MVVTSNDGIDELSITSTASVHELRHNEISLMKLILKTMTFQMCNKRNSSRDFRRSLFIWNRDLKWKRGQDLIW